MTDEATPAGTAEGQAQAPAQIKMQVLGQFIKDLSFENVVMQKGMSGNSVPEISVQVSLDGKKRGAEHQYEVTTKYTVTAKQKDGDDTMFLLELQYGGIFHIENIPADQLHAFMLIECPRMTFPFARRIIHDIVRDGGFPPLNLDTIDWVALYRQNIARMAEAAKAAETAKN